MPGFQVIDIGYSEEGYYNVVLIGKVRSTTSKKPIVEMQSDIEEESQHKLRIFFSIEFEGDTIVTYI
jgi:hypothetical protein